MKIRHRDGVDNRKHNLAIDLVEAAHAFGKELGQAQPGPGQNGRAAPGRHRRHADARKR